MNYHADETNVKGHNIPLTQTKPFDLQTGSTARPALDASLGFPRPALFMAMTLNSYSDPSVSWMALMVRSITGLRLTLVHVSSVASRFSIMYPRMVALPSLAGAFQLTVMESLVMLVMTGGSQGPGTSGERETHQGEHQHTDRKLYCLSLHPYITAVY